LAVGGIASKLVARRTTDAGATWTNVDIGSMSGKYFTAVACADQSHCWVATANPAIYATADGGQTWAEQSTPGVKGVDDYSEIFCTDVERCWVPSGNKVLATQNGGKDWQVQSPSKVNFLSSVGCSSANRCVAVGGPDIVSTTDGGQTWLLDLQTPLTEMHLNSVACPSFCLAVGEESALGTAWLEENP
jgi:photosystem II stability/assembly factor-like uncharacterized protein